MGPNATVELLKSLRDADGDADAWDALLSCLKEFSHSGVEPGELNDAAPAVLDRYRKCLERLSIPRAPDTAPHEWDRKIYYEKRAAELLLDLFGFLRTPETEAALDEAIHCGDHRFQFFAARSYLQLGKDVPIEALKSVAANPETRVRLFEMLEEHDKLESFPKQFFTQTAFAESEMVEWLSFPTELGAPPDEIELIDVVEGEIDGELCEYYLFRFRNVGADNPDDEGWMVGWSGAFPKADSPTPYSDGGVFSEFTPWESKTVEEHLADVRALFDLYD